MIMKSFLKVWYVAIVGAVVFLGALYIFEGVRAREETARQSESAQAEARAADISGILDAGEGSAL